MNKTKELLNAILHRLDTLDTKVEGFHRKTHEHFDKLMRYWNILVRSEWERDNVIRKLKKKSIARTGFSF